MALDTSIPMSYNPSTKLDMEGAYNFAMNQRKNALLEQNAQMQLAEKQNALRQQQELRNFMATADFNDPNVRNKLMGFDPTGESFKNVEAAYNSRSKGGLDDFKLALEKHKAYRQILTGLVATNASRDQVIAAVNGAVQRGIITPEVGQHYVEKLPEDPAQLQSLLKQGALEEASPEQIMALHSPKVDFQTTNQGIEGLDINPNSSTFSQTLIRRGAPPKSPGVTINTNDRTDFEANKVGIGRLYDAYDRLSGAPEYWQSLEQARALASGKDAGKFMGTGGEPLLEAVNFLNSRFGTHIDTKGVTDVSQLRSLLFQGVMENLRKLDAQPSQQQQFALQQALGSIGSDPNALVRIIDWSQKQLEQRVERHNKNAKTAGETIRFPYDISIQMPTRQTTPDGTSVPAPPSGFKIK